MNILYVHGIGSNRNGNTVNWMREYLVGHTIYSFDIPADPDAAISFIKNKCDELDINLIVGTSLGGFYAMQIYGVQKILINPAIKAYETVANVIGIGTHEYLGDREDGIQQYTIDDVFVEKLKTQAIRHFENIDEEVTAETYGIFGTQDEVCDFRQEFINLYRDKQFWEADFGHRMTEDIFTTVFMNVFRQAEEDYNKRVW